MISINLRNLSQLFPLERREIRRYKFTSDKRQMSQGGNGMRFVVLAGIAALGASAALAAQPVPPGDAAIIDGTAPHPLTDVAGDPVAGRDAASDRGRGNCMTCHPIGEMAEVPFQGDIAPALDGVADRYDEAQLRAIVINSKEVFGEQTFMPAMYRVDGLKIVRKESVGVPILTAQEVEDVVAYLKTLKE
jgi:sulfur-oxidizing protein SoxX